MEKTDNVELIKIKNCSLKDATKTVKIPAIESGKICTVYIQ